VTKEVAGWVCFPVMIGQSEEAFGRRKGKEFGVHDGTMAFRGRKSDRSLRGGIKEEVLENRTKVPQGVNCKRENDHITLEEVLNEIIAMGEGVSGRGDHVCLVKFALFISLKMCVSIGRNGG
jgi:hypothetical protein